VVPVWWGFTQGYGSGWRDEDTSHAPELPAGHVAVGWR